MSKTYDGKAIEITYDVQRCIHARNCVLQQPDVFDPDAKPWIQPDGAKAEESAATIRTCPSGALTFRRKDGGTEEQVPKMNRVRVLENGPLALTGDLDIAGVTRIRATLCRCGQSRTMPYCNNAHVKSDFKATGEPQQKVESIEITGKTAKLVVTPAKDGPLRMKGPAQVVTGTGHKTADVAEQAFCRCGHSSNKPFCDGSHNDIAFKAPGS